MKEELKSNQNEEIEANNEIIDLENDNPENSTEHINKPIINIEKNEVNNKEKQDTKLKLIQDKINQEINSKDLEDMKSKKNSKENSSHKEAKKHYQNLIISNNNFSIAKSPKKEKNTKNIKINN